MTGLLRGLTIGTSVGAAAMGGVLFAFSAFVMPALKRLPAAQGLAAMQSINITAVRPPLMILMFGTAAGAVALAATAAVQRDGRASWLTAGGSALYLLGVVGVTAAYHVPRNDALALLDAANPSSFAAWTRYLAEWTAWNQVRVAAGIVAGAVLAVAARG